MNQVSKLLFTSGMIFCLAFSSCSEKKNANVSSAEKCPDLKVIFDKIDAFYPLLLPMTTEWPDREEALTEIIELLETNMQQATNDCKFTNHQLFPQTNRFEFVENFTKAIILEGHGHAIEWLVHLQGIFAKDKEISEFFKEELGEIAADAPGVYMDHYTTLAMIDRARLVQNTWWAPEEREKLISIYRNIEEGEAIAQYMEMLGK